MSAAAPGDRVGRLAHEAARWLRGVRIAYLPQFDRRPAVKLLLGPALPGWALRVVTGLLAASCFVAVTTSRGVLVLAGLLVALILLRPGRLLPVVIAIAVGVLLALGPEPTVLRTAALVLGLHLMAVLGTVAAQVSWRARIEVAVLVPPLRRLVAVQLLAQPVALVGALAAGAHLDLAVLTVAAVLGLGALILLWAPARAED